MKSVKASDVFWLRQPYHSLLALGLLLGLGGLLLSALYVWGWGRYQLYQEKQTELTEQLVRYQRLVAQRPVLTQQLQAARQQQTVQQAYLTKKAPALAAADLQEFLRQTAEASGGRLISVQGLPPLPEAGFTRVGLKVHISGGIETLQRVIHRLESSLKPALLLGGVVLQSRTVRPPPLPGQPPPVARTELDMHFEVYGYLPPGT